MLRFGCVAPFCHVKSVAIVAFQDPGAAEHVPVSRAAKSVNPSVFLTPSSVGLQKLNCSLTKSKML